MGYSRKRRRFSRGRRRRTRGRALSTRIATITSVNPATGFLNQYAFGQKGLENKCCFLPIQEAFDASDIALAHNTYITATNAVKGAIPLVLKFSGKYQIKSESLNDQTVTLVYWRSRYDTGMSTFSYGTETWSDLNTFMIAALAKEGTTVIGATGYPIGFDPGLSSFFRSYFKFRTKSFTLRTGKFIQFSINKKHRYINCMRVNGANNAFGAGYTFNQFAALSSGVYAIVTGGVGVTAGLASSNSDFTPPAFAVSGYERYDCWPVGQYDADGSKQKFYSLAYANTVTNPTLVNERTGTVEVNSNA